MRKILTVATGILLLAASCSKEADNETKLPAPDENQIRATIEPVFSDATTRSEFDSNMKIIWSLGDQIGVMTPEKPDANMTYVIREQSTAPQGYSRWTPTSNWKATLFTPTIRVPRTTAA